MLQPRRRFLSRVKMQDFLNELDKTPCHKPWSIHLPPGLLRAEIEDSLRELIEPPDIYPELAKFASGSKTGAVLFWSQEWKYLVLPPFPIVTRTTFQGIATEPLRSLLQHNYCLALVLIRLGAYAIGISYGENLLSHKVGTGLVHARHKKGGSSQARFARHREKQIEYFLTRVCHHTLEQLQPHAKVLDYLVYGGAWTTILSFKKRCPFISQFDDRTLPPLLDIAEPRKAVLETAVSRVWSSTLMEWRED